MITLIAAVSDNNVIGHKGKMPWHIPEDLQRFKRLTLGHPIIMGRVTFDSLPRKPLPGRENIVVTRNPDQLLEYASRGVVIAHDVSDALRLASQYTTETYVIGGTQIYQQTFPLADRLEITRVHGNYEGDAFFPEIHPDEWKESSREENGGYDFLTYLRGK